MKLAEALLLRSENKQKIENLQYRILANIKVQEGDKPLENPQSLMHEVFELNEQLCALIKRINACNNATKLPTGQTLSEAIVERDMLMKNGIYYRLWPQRLWKGTTGLPTPRLK